MLDPQELGDVYTVEDLLVALAIDAEIPRMDVVFQINCKSIFIDIKEYLQMYY